MVAPNNDTVDTLVVFAHGSEGNTAPKRALKTWRSVSRVGLPYASIMTIVWPVPSMPDAMT